MHDLIHDLAVSVSGGECSAIKNQETWRASYGSPSLRHIAFVPDSSDVTMIFQSLCCGELGGLRSLLLARRPDVWVKKEVVNEIPDIVVQTLVSLRALDLGYVRLQHLPDSVWSLKHLRYLDLSRTRIEVFPESVCQLYLLQTLDLSYARITELSDSLKYLTELRYLNLCYSGVRMLPETVGELMNLRTLDLAYTGISNLPQSVGNLRHLTFLDLSGALVSEFPKPICLLYNLRTLNLNNVAIDQLPDSIGNLQKLHHLNLNETRIETLPESICDLHLLQVLNLSFSRLRKLPKSIGNLRCLSHLDLSSTRVRRLPKSICSVHSLQSLLLKGSCLSRLPEEMGSLTNLQHLDFSSECVYTPSGIGGLTNLRTLPALNLELRGSLQISGLQFVNEFEHVDMAGLRANTQIDKLTLDWRSIRSWQDAHSLSSEESASDTEQSDLRDHPLSSEESASDTEQSDLRDHPLSSEESAADTEQSANEFEHVHMAGLTMDWRSIRSWEEDHSLSSEGSASDLRDHPLSSEGSASDLRDHLLSSEGSASDLRDHLLSSEKSVSDTEQSDLRDQLQPHHVPTELEEEEGDPHSSSESWCGNDLLDFEQPGLLERLQPHCGLRALQVLGFRGRAFPGWMGDPSFPRLVQLVLEGCANCSCLPALGQLPTLKQLTIAGASSVERIGPEFRFSNGGEGRRGAFPSLEEMRVQHMTKWSKWVGVQNGDFPRLAWLEIEDCPALRGDLPFSSTCSLPMLKVLKIRDCPSLLGVFLQNLPNLGTAEFKQCEHLSDIDFGNLMISSSSAAASPSSSSSSSTTSTEMELRSLRIIGCPHARFLQGEGHLLPRTLTYLFIDSQCGCLLEWCLGDGNEWLSQIPYTAVRRSHE
ncbi:hypothetical protein Taro_052552, partial [Colocasia esculenta]|nr:hypothetical protein [Colocasia esculenta]